MLQKKDLKERFKMMLKTPDREGDIHPLKLPLPSPLQLLVVQGVDKNVELVLRTIEKTGVVVECDLAGTATTCQQLLESKNYDAVLCNCRMPDFTALDLLQLLQECERDIPSIAIADCSEAETALDCIKAGITGCVFEERLFLLPQVLAGSLAEFARERQKRLEIERLRASAQREAIINRIVGAMRGTLVLDEVLQTTVDLVHEHLGVNRCMVFMKHPSAENSAGKMQINYVSAATLEGKQLIGKQCSLFGCYEATLMRGNSVVLSRINSHNASEEAIAIARKWGIRAILIMPLAYEGEFLGSIGLHQCDREREWSADELTLMTTITDQCAIAIHHAQLFALLQKQASREQLLNRISRELNSSLEPAYILEEIVRLTGQFFGVERAVIFSIEAERVKVVNEWRASNAIASLLELEASRAEWLYPLDSNYDLEKGWVFHEPSYDKMLKYPGLLSQLQQGEIRSILRVSIYIQDRLFGGLSLHAIASHRTFIEEEIKLLQRIADRAAIALYNAQSYERLEQTVKQRTQQLEREKIHSEAANIAKTDFLNNMSHELRTPLTGILGFSEVLLNGILGKLNEKQYAYIASILESGKHLLELINDLLDLSKVEAGKEDLNLQNLAVQDVCDSCLSLVRERARNRGLELRQEIARDTFTFVADLRRIKQILFNLLSNAIKFTDSGSVTLKVDRAEGYIRFCAIDTGIGIAPENIATLFQPFKQIDSGLNRQYEGTGLGLALSRKLAKLHGGDISVESELGKGSCFILWLPDEALPDRAN